MKKLFVTFFLTLYSILSYCQHPYKQGLGSAAYLTFPDTPKVDYKRNLIGYSVTDKEYNLYYADISDVSPDSTGPRSLNAYYKGTANAMIKGLDGKILYEKPVEWNHIKGMAFYSKCQINGYTYFAYQQYYCVSKTVVGISLLSRDSLSRNDPKVRAFFDKLVLTPARAATQDKKISLIAALLMLGSVIFALGLIVFIAKKVTKTKTHTWPN